MSMGCRWGMGKLVASGWWLVSSCWIGRTESVYQDWRAVVAAAGGAGDWEGTCMVTYLLATIRSKR